MTDQPIFTPARTAQLDQGRAAVDEAVDDILTGTRQLLTDTDPNEVLCALYEVMKGDGEMAYWVAAGAILRIAQGQP